jgi:cellulose synthase/poly-beta-1,6-N-acetylglucosamine synthase-like glycosyltransferase
MTAWLIVFLVSCFIIFYNYIGYALLAYLINLVSGKQQNKFTGRYFPSVSFIVAAFNEEDCIEKKIYNSLAQDYPAEKIEFIFITDGSTDRTMDLIRQFPRIRLLHQPERKGKTAALNRVVKAATNDILIFSDANTMLNTLATKNITRHYEDAKVGGVAGEKKVISEGISPDEVGQGEGLYWKYESFLKKIDSDFYSVVGAAGELFSLRRSLYEPVEESVILDDFIISMKVAQKGYRIVYEPEAFAMELPSFSIGDEQKRKVRISAGGFQAMGMLGALFQFWKQPRLSFLYISHRVLRWTLSPVCMIIAFISNIILVYHPGSPVFQVLLAAQVLFYFMAILGSFLPLKGPFSRLFRLAYYFMFMNISVVLGFFRHLRGKQPAAWEKARRNQAYAHSKIP